MACASTSSRSQAPRRDDNGGVQVGSAMKTSTATGSRITSKHLMFKGTGQLIARRHRKMDDAQRGRNNANTSEGCHHLPLRLCRDQWDTALKIEADRMRNLRIDPKHEFEQEKAPSFPN